MTQKNRTSFMNDPLLQIRVQPASKIPTLMLLPIIVSLRNYFFKDDNPS